MTVALAEETKLRMQFYAVSICHQTHTLHHPALNLWGWDSLEHAFLNIATTNNKLIDPAFFAKLSVSELKIQLHPLFSPDTKPENCTLDRLDKRAKLMIEALNFILKNYNGIIGEMMTSTGQKPYNNDKGVYEILAKRNTFSDPMQKKSTFLIKLLEESALLKIKAPEYFIPIMDYHMQRVLLRLGCVDIPDQLTHRQLVNRKSIE